MKIGELAVRSGLSVHTLRYYERIGLLPYASRDGGGRRDFDSGILPWIEFLGRLKATGMPIREMLEYAALRDRGAGTAAQRRMLLEVHRDRVRRHLAELQASLVVLDAKIAGYAGATEGTDHHDGNRHHTNRNDTNRNDIARNRTTRRDAAPRAGRRKQAGTRPARAR